MKLVPQGPLLDQGHYIRENKAAALPRRLLFLDTETEGSYSDVLGAELHKFKVGWTWYLTKGKKGYDPDGGKWVYHTEAKSLLDYIASRCVKGSPLYIVASNVVFDLGATGFFHYFTEEGWELDFYHSKGMSFILVIHQDRKITQESEEIDNPHRQVLSRKHLVKIKALSIQNFLPMSIEKIGETIGLPKLDVDFGEVSDEELKTYCRRDTEILGKGFLYYLSFLTDNDCGGFSPTLSGQSMRCYRHKSMAHRILVYHDEEVIDMEREAYFGGRCEAFRIGDQGPGDFVQLDVNSMYPYVMMNHHYPCGFRQWRFSPSPEELTELLESYCVIADVSLQTDCPAYPKTINGKTCFPVGRFNTMLCSDSLSFAIENGDIHSVRYVLVYERAPLFVRYVEAFMGLRRKYQEEENELMEKVCKLFSNSLYGKFGEQRDVVIRDEFTEENDFWRVPYWNADRRKSGVEETFFHRYRQIEGKVEAPNSVPAIAAHVTDYARNYLLELMYIVGLEDVYYVDTDSMITTRERMGQLPGELLGMDYGQMKIEEEGERLVIHGCKDYRLGGKSKQKGIRGNAVASTGGVFTQEQFPTLAGLLRKGVDDGVPIMSVTKVVGWDYDKGTPDALGRVHPLVRKEF